MFLFVFILGMFCLIIIVIKLIPYIHLTYISEKNMLTTILLSNNRIFVSMWVGYFLNNLVMKIGHYRYCLSTNATIIQEFQLPNQKLLYEKNYVLKITCQ